MDDEEINYHEHEMVPVEKPAVKSAKTFCMLVLAICVGGTWYYLQAPPAVKTLIDANDFWPCVVVGAVVVLFAIRAFLS